MGQPSASPPPLSWDGKCQTCRKLMSRCMCFQGPESDARPLHTAAAQATLDASETRPLWNALRKMHRSSAGARLSLLQPSTRPSTSSSSRPSTSSSSRPSTSSREPQRKRSEALPPLSAPTSSSSSSRHHLHRRSDARPPQSSRRSSREPRREPSPERASTSRKDRLQRAGFTSSSHDLKREAAMRSASSIDKHKYARERLSYEPDGGSGPASDEDEETVWEL
ncbi:uncharacterized protein IUM83_13991 [Phytophthora cinnamomi]|uniref:uncharacterized protein n=1 Tax=Phytophthora cinnamomi TaxID=4785 RepID=UPI0035595129|nr:hypothetical protein IUM83_13991 [Phytophthora cinnamomi]